MNLEDLDLGHLDDQRARSGGAAARAQARQAGRRLRRRRQLAIATPLAVIVAAAIAVPLALVGTSNSAGVQRISPIAPTSAPPTSAAPPRTTPPATAGGSLLSALPTVDQNAGGDLAPAAGYTLLYAVHGLSTDGAASRFDVWGSSSESGHSAVQLRAATTGALLWSAAYDVDVLPLFGPSAGLTAVSLADRADHVFARFVVGVSAGQFVSFDVRSHQVGLLGTGPVGGAHAKFVNANGTVAEDVDHDGVDEVADDQWNPAVGGSRAADSASGAGMSVNYYRVAHGTWVRYAPPATLLSMREIPQATTAIAGAPYVSPAGNVVRAIIGSYLSNGQPTFAWTVTAGPHGFPLNKTEFAVLVHNRPATCVLVSSTSLVNTVVSAGQTVSVDERCVSGAPLEELAAAYAPYGTVLARWNNPG
jgi:hypothetical protein